MRPRSKERFQRWHQTNYGTNLLSMRLRLVTTGYKMLQFPFRLPSQLTTLEQRKATKTWQYHRAGVDAGRPHVVGEVKNKYLGSKINTSNSDSNFTIYIYNTMVLSRIVIWWSKLNIWSPLCQIKPKSPTLIPCASTMVRAARLLNPAVTLLACCGTLKFFYFQLFSQVIFNICCYKEYM